MASVNHGLLAVKFRFPPRNIKILSNYFIRKLSSAKTEEHDVIDQIFPDVKGSPATLPANFFKKSKFPSSKKQDKVKLKNSVDKTKHVIIDCKNEALNHYINQKYDKFDRIPLASKGWFNKQAKGDYFKINIFPDKVSRENVFWMDGLETYEGLGLDDNILEVLKKLGFTRPTYIQASGIPQVLENQNTLLAGETGCGKTLAYLLPVVQQIMRWRSVVPERKLNTPLALILVPGRELAHQIGDVADQLARELMFDIDVAIGGHLKQLITHPNFRPVDLFISSIGAASKLTTSGVYNMSLVRHIVLDEADTMLDDSFNDYVVRYLKKYPISYGKSKENYRALPEFCQLTLVSATVPTSIATILEDVIVPESLATVETPRLHQVLVHVPQFFYRLGQSQKPSKLLELVKKNMAKEIPTIIFSNRTKVCDWISMFLNENGVSCVNLNGDMPNDVRMGRFDQFQRGFVDVISCTDVTSRGLDTIRAKHVINYDFPVYISDYIHRCGRVGRVGYIEDCLITNFVSGSREIELVQKIENAVRTMSTLPNVNANITRVIQNRVIRNSNIT